LIVTERAINNCHGPIMGKNCAARVTAIAGRAAVRDRIVEERAVMNGEVTAIVEDSAPERSATPAAEFASIATEGSTRAATRP
jgi:hypothetical protein